MAKTKKKYEAHLNELYADAFSQSEAVDKFCYFRDGKISNRTLISAYHNRTLGTLLRRYDSIAFEVGYNDWSRSN